MPSDESSDEDIKNVEEIVEELRELENNNRYPTKLQHAIRQAAGRLESAVDKAKIERRKNSSHDDGSDKNAE